MVFLSHSFPKRSSAVIYVFFAYFARLKAKVLKKSFDARHSFHFYKGGVFKPKMLQETYAVLWRR